LGGAKVSEDNDLREKEAVSGTANPDRDLCECGHVRDEHLEGRAECKAQDRDDPAPCPCACFDLMPEDEAP
jgi:hypothetical protein